MSPKVPPFSFFVFCIDMDVQKILKGPPFTFFGTMRLTGDFKKIRKKTVGVFFHSDTVEENTRHFDVLLLFLILRYGADFGRSRLVSLSFSTIMLNFFQQVIIGSFFRRVIIVGCAHEWSATRISGG